MIKRLGPGRRRDHRAGLGGLGNEPLAVNAASEEPPEPRPHDEVDEWGYESFPASDPPQH